jgi:signal transduction histidine kinase
MAEIVAQKATRSKFVSWLIVSLTLCILGSGITLITLHLRRVFRAQMLQSYADVLYNAALAQTENSDLDEVEKLLGDDDQQAAESAQLLTVLEASKARPGVFSVQLFTSDGKPSTGFGAVREATPLSKAELEKLGTLSPSAEYEPRMDLLRLLGGEMKEKSPNGYPIIRVLTPLVKNSKYAGAAEFILDGEKVATALKALDYDLFKFAFQIFIIGGAGIATSLIWAFSRLQRSNTLLLQRTQSLIKANHELTLAAKTSAVGAITAHLIHDLKSPLFGLQSFVTSRATEGGADEEDWNLAIDTTRRMQKVISDIVKILQEEKGASKYEISIAEWSSLLQSKIEPQATKAGLTFHAENSDQAVLSNKDANILLLVATNILQNAIQATPRGGCLSVHTYFDEDTLLIDMQDTGPGLPESIMATLFTPSRSTKSGGTGLGLAISKQLANHMGADLILKRTSREGTVFQLRIPEKILVQESELAIP